MSVAGGLPRALERGAETGCGVVQLFLKSQLQWRGRPLDEGEAVAFRRTWVATGLGPVFAHASYLVNLAAPDATEWRRSVDALTDELERAERLGLPWVVVHPGSHKGAGREAGLRQVTRAADQLAARTPGYRVRLALENTAGAGHTVGSTAADLHAILDGSRRPERLAVCLDTCHLFAAGHDIRTAKGLRATLARFSKTVGADRIVAFHLNDAKAPLGSGLDRHEHIGQGRIGLTAFRALLNHTELGRRPMVLETPKAGEGDVRNLAALRDLRRGPP
jgi:deoxyribonuclease-4